MLNFQSKRFFFLLATCYLLLASCGVSKQISKSAQQSVLSDSSLLTAHIGISIYEPASSKYWYNYNGEKYFVPASNTKIPTCYAAMKYLGDSLVGLRYETLDTIAVLSGTADPTFLHPDFSSSSILSFLKNFKTVILNQGKNDFDYLGFGWTSDDYLSDYMAERSSFPMYGNTIKFELQEGRLDVKPNFFEHLVYDDSGTLYKNRLQQYNGINIFRPKESNDYKIASGRQKFLYIPFHTREFQASRMENFLQAKLLADTLKLPVYPGKALKYNQKQIIHSQPTDSLLKPMMHRSDNFFAEQSLLMVSNEMLGVMNDAKIIDTLLKTDFKDLPQKPRWVDGSGLSRYNLFTPQDFVAILGKMKNEFGMDRIKEIFPTGGEGTISSYYKSDSGYIYAKTGTLSGVVALSGFLTTKKGKQLIFSVLVNNHNNSATAVRRAVERFIHGIREKY